MKVEMAVLAVPSFLCGRKATLNLNPLSSKLGSCVKVVVYNSLKFRRTLPVPNKSV